MVIDKIDKKYKKHVQISYRSLGDIKILQYRDKERKD